MLRLIYLSYFISPFLSLLPCERGVPSGREADYQDHIGGQQHYVKRKNKMDVGAVCLFTGG